MRTDPDKESMAKPVIVAPARHFLPGFKAGGPIRSLAALCRSLGSDYEFRIVTSDRDYGDSRPYEDIHKGKWMTVAGARVRYLSRTEIASGAMIRMLRECRPRLLYLNSCFDPAFTILPLAARRVGILGEMPVVLAPRGELSPGALRQKTRKKELFLSWAGRFGLFRNVWWQASAFLEKEEIESVGKRFPGICPSSARILLARNLVSLERPRDMDRPPKKPGELRAVFLSRVAPKKNLAEAIRLLGGVKGTVSLDVFGLLDPDAYWEECRKARESFAPGVALAYRGPVPHEQALRTFSQYDVFLFPTLGENFGHAILESLTAGCPVLVSDRTPWRGLDTRRAGWVLPVGDRDAWVRILQELADMPESRHLELRSGARAMAGDAIADTQAVDDHRALFERALAESGDER